MNNFLKINNLNFPRDEQDKAALLPLYYDICSNICCYITSAFLVSTSFGWEVGSGFLASVLMGSLMNPVMFATHICQILQS